MSRRGNKPLTQDGYEKLPDVKIILRNTHNHTVDEWDTIRRWILDSLNHIRTYEDQYADTVTLNYFKRKKSNDRKR